MTDFSRFSANLTFVELPKHSRAARQSSSQIFMSKNLENFLMKNMILIENLLKNSKIKMMNVNIRNYLMIKFRNNSKKLNRFKNKDKDIT